MNEDESIIETEIDDEIQDWKNLSKLSASSLPKRGEKDYEPDGTTVQMTQLQESQNSMFNALDCTRGHMIKQNIRCYWMDDVQKGMILKPKGSFLQTCGKIDKENRCWLNLNEFIYLSERGTIEPWNYEKDVAMDLNSAYAMGFQLEDHVDEYQVYSHLKRNGYIVLDHDESISKKAVVDTKKSIWSDIIRGILDLGVIKKLVEKFLWYPSFHPLQFVHSKYGNYSQIFNSIKLIPFRETPPATHGSTSSSTSTTASTSELSTATSIQPQAKITFDVWKPNPQFSKTKPQPPDFQVIMLNVNKYKLPTLRTLQSLFKQNNTTIPNPKKEPSTMTKLKNGQGNLILAIVDYGVINFVKISQGVFETEDVWFVEDKQKTRMRQRK